MHMKTHLLTALQEEFDQWETLLRRVDEAQAVAPLAPSEWSIKDVLAHLAAWQQRSTARFEAARLGREPEYPRWPEGLDPETKDDPVAINAWIFTAHRDQPWAKVYQDWRAGFQHFLEAAEAIPERDLLDSDRFPWMKGYSLADVLLGSYDHHQEHLEGLPKHIYAR